jgi:hypothetical protein
MRKRNQGKNLTLDFNSVLKSLHSSIVMARNATRTMFRLISEIRSVQVEQ